MQLKFRIIILFCSFFLFLYGQNKKDFVKPVKDKKENVKSAKKQNEISFSNDQDTEAYLDMLRTILNRVSSSYVDSVNESELIKSGIKGMMKPLDPYSKFLSGSSKDRLDMLRTG